jgi:7-keto-8-aminopelargonate synthetase-like enzyme
VTASYSYEIPSHNAELAHLVAEHPMVDSVVDQVDGRMIRIGDHWLADFASCNYLGFDLDPEIIAGVPAYLDAWGPIRAGRGGSPARPCTSRSRPRSGTCWGSRTCSPSRP